MNPMDSGTGEPARLPRFAVCLAAFNGMDFFVEQIESILRQSGVLVQVFISVDRSVDGTEEKLTEWALTEPRLALLPLGLRFGGAARNFFRLFRDVDFSGYDYLALADQDDVWIEDKLLVAHQRITGGCFSAYSGNVTAFWPDGRLSLVKKAQPQKRFDFMFQGGGPGCSYVLCTKEALEFKVFLLQHWSVVNEVSMHDWLIYAWFRAMGFKWLIDDASKVLYRQHEGNLFGANSGFHGVFNRLKMLRSGWYRAEIAKIAVLVSDRVPGLPSSLVENGSVPRSFILKNIGQMRRRLPERIFLFFVLMLGLY